MDVDMTRAHVAVEILEITITIMNIKIEVQAVVNQKRTIHITTQTPTRVTGQMGIMTIMTQMGNLFSKGGSGCC